MTVHIYSANRGEGSRITVRRIGEEGPDAPDYICPVALDSDNSHSLQDQYAYLDVGRWGGTNRNFGIIYGYGDSCYVAVCQYTPAGQSYTPATLPEPATANSAVSHPVIQFLRHCRGTILHGRAFDSVDTQEKFYLILGDLHLPLVNHFNRPDPSRTPLPEIKCRVDAAYMDSIIPSLNDFASLQAVATSGLISLSPGMDRLMINSPMRWYERYNESDIFTDQSSNAVAEDLKAFIELAQRWSYTGIQVHLIQLGDMYELWVGLKRLFEGTESSRRQVNISAPTQTTCYFNNSSSISDLTCNDCNSTPPQTSQYYRGVVQGWVEKVNDTTSIQSTSLAQWLHHQTTFTHKTWLYGNHDNYLRDSSLCGAVNIPNRVLNLPEHDILFEHGHEGDEYNRDGAASGHAITQGGAFVWDLRPFVALGEQSQRRNFIRYATEKFVRTRDPIKILVMAHTHIPYLAIVRLGAGFPA